MSGNARLVAQPGKETFGIIYPCTWFRCGLLMPYGVLKPWIWVNIESGNRLLPLWCQAFTNFDLLSSRPSRKKPHLSYLSHLRICLSPPPPLLYRRKGGIFPHYLANMMRLWALTFPWLSYFPLLYILACVYRLQYDPTVKVVFVSCYVKLNQFIY